MYHLHTDEMVCDASWVYHPMDLCKVNTVKDLTRILGVLCVERRSLTSRNHGCKISSSQQ